MSEPTNPYAAPQASLSTTTDPSLASPWLRFGAVIIDGIVLFPINYLLGRILLSMPSMEEQVEAAKKGQDALNGIMPGKGMMLVAQLLGIVVFLAVNFVFLKKGQTIGKMALKLQIQNRNTGALLPVQDLITRRLLPVYAVAAIATVIQSGAGVVVVTGSQAYAAVDFRTVIYWALILILAADALCIFRPKRNTLHDDLANTKVVKLPA